MKWSKRAKRLAEEKGISRDFVERNLRLFSGMRMKGLRFYERGEKVCVSEYEEAKA